MNFTRKCLHRRDNNAVIIAICCSSPWLFSASNAHRSPHPIAATAAALALVVIATLAATYVCRKRCIVA
jgi:hypothetical protein